MSTNNQEKRSGAPAASGKPSDPLDKKQALLSLSHDLGREERQLAILGEGNTSIRLTDETFLVKASGSSLGTLGPDDVVECRFKPLLAMLEQKDLSEQQIEDELFACRVDPEAKKPSIESLFHAYLLSLPGIQCVAHTHPVSANQILTSPRADDFAERRLCPDEVVCCGATFVVVPYSDPGLILSQKIRKGVTEYLDDHGVPPRVILLENHGVITLGPSPAAARASMLMTDKAARIFLGAVALGGPIFLKRKEAERIANRLDEHHRQRALQL